jgi:hypothetical protein
MKTAVKTAVDNSTTVSHHLSHGRCRTKDREEAKETEYRHEQGQGRWPKVKDHGAGSCYRGPNLIPSTT